ncbi:MAG: transposase [Solobacterium sp.]|nr:transposase [Solobacterium sp.]
MMMKDVLFAYMNQVYSLRQMEERCRNDIRFLYLSEEEVKKLKAERKLNTEDLDQVNGGYLYQSGSEDGYRIHLIDDKTGDDIATYYYFEWEDAEDMARNINVSDRYISWEEWCALREKNKKYTPERSDSGPVV